MCIQVDGVMMGSPLGSLIANIFMCELETAIIPKLNIKMWTRYVDDTFAFVKPEEVDHIHRTLNEYEPKIQFTYEMENERKLSFLDVTIERNDILETSVYRKKTNNNIYMNWYSYSPRSWKIGTLRNLVRRAIMISSECNLQTELDHLHKVFSEINQYPSKLTKDVIADEIEHHRNLTTEQPDDNNENDEHQPEEEEEIKMVHLNLPYGGEKGQKLVRKLQKNIKTNLKDKVRLRTTYTPCKLGSHFQIKDKTKLEHQHNVSYYIKCANKKCPDDYVGNTKRRTFVRTMDHNSKDKNSHVLMHSKNTKHRRVYLPDVKIIGKGYRTHFRRFVSEALFIKELKPSLNVQKEAFKLKLFN